MVRAITFDAFGTIIDTGRDVLIRIARAVCDDHRLALDPEALLATWDRYFFGPEGETFLTLEEITEGSLGKAFREHGIEGDPRPYVDDLVSLWREGECIRRGGPRICPVSRKLPCPTTGSDTISLFSYHH